MGLLGGKPFLCTAIRGVYVVAEMPSSTWDLLRVTKVHCVVVGWKGSPVSSRLKHSPTTLLGVTVQLAAWPCRFFRSTRSWSADTRLSRKNSAVCLKTKQILWISPSGPSCCNLSYIPVASAPSIECANLGIAAAACAEDCTDHHELIPVRSSIHRHRSLAILKTQRMPVAKNL